MVPLATGSDGAGSVRIPPAWCAVIGLKPTNGTVPARDKAGLNIAGPHGPDRIRPTAARPGGRVHGVLAGRLPATVPPLRAKAEHFLAFVGIAAILIGHWRL